jgi:hypothetical protein
MNVNVAAPSWPKCFVGGFEVDSPIGSRAPYMPSKSNAIGQVPVKVNPQWRGAMRIWAKQGRRSGSRVQHSILRGLNT